MRDFRQTTPPERVAQEANELADLGWDRVTISRIETGKRALTIEEFVFLPAILFAATGRRTSMAGLLKMAEFKGPRPLSIGNLVIEEGEARPRNDYEPIAKRQARETLELYEKAASTQADADASDTRPTKAPKAGRSGRKA
jgi:hypothetical protein